MSEGGGVERATQLLVNQLALETNEEIYVLSKSGMGKLPFFPLSSKIHYSTFHKHNSCRGISILYDVFQLYRYLWHNHIDILVVVEISLSIFTLILQIILPHIKYVYWEHFCVLFDNHNRRLCRLRSFALRYGDAYVTLTNQDKDFLSKKFPKQKNIRTIPNIAPYPLQANIYDKSSCTIITLGNLLPEKGSDLAVQTAIKLLKRYPKWKWEFYGDGPLLEILKKKVAISGCEEKINFHARTKDVSHIYSKAAIYVLPSRSEGFGLVLLEAMAFHVPVVAFDVPFGPQNLICNNESGVLVKAEDTEAMVTAIANLIEHPKLREKYAENAARKLLLYLPEVIVAQWEELLNSL